jgi:polyisoprenoid-binding protein YceI
MKKLKLIASALLLAVSVIVSAQTKKVDVSKSTVKWVGKKVTGEHSGTIAIKQGSLVFKGAKLAGGKFVIDMTKIVVTDLQAGQGKEDLEKHLNADDFFGVKKFSTSTLVFKTIADKGNGVYTITADMTIKSITKPVVFDMTVAGNTATANVVVNRTEYDIKYGSGTFFQNLGDKTISDNFDLNVSLSF